MTTRVLLLAAVLVTACQISALASVTLFSGGVAHYEVVLPPDPDEKELFAAAEFEKYMARLAGVAELRQPLAPTVRVEIGRAAGNPMMLERASVDESGFFIEVAGSTVRLAGATPTATLYAVYDLLERLGCRWFMPGEIGEVVPARRSIELEDFSEVQIPAFTGRILQALPPGEESEIWALRNKLGGARFPGAHSWSRLVPPQRHFEMHPECFALVDGQRTPKQLCTSNPATIMIAAHSIMAMHEADPDTTWFGIGPNDGGGFCECDDCTALDSGDIDPFSGNVSLTDRVVTFANAVAAQVHRVYPEIKFGFYAYHDYVRPPKRVMPDPSIVPAIAPINLCRLHGMGDPVCAERNYHQYLIREWTRISPVVYHRGYSYNLAGPNLPLNYASRWGFEIPYCSRNGIAGFRVETQMSWANHGPLGYIMAKLMWDVRHDHHELLDDYYTRFYGPAAKPMGLYWAHMDRERRRAPHHTGNAVNIPDIYTPRVMSQLRIHLVEAERLASGDRPFEARVQIARKSFDYLSAFLRMREHSEAQSWGRAAGALRDMREIGEWFVQYDPPLMSARGGLNNLERFWAPIVEQAAQRTSEGNRHVVSFRDEWRTFIDPNDVGEFVGYASPRIDDNDWQTLRTYSASWSDQGLRYYRGNVWYRQAVNVRGEWGGRRMMLWFGGVDNNAKVWVNGTYIGSVETNGWQPVEFDITHAVRFGLDNLVAVKVTNDRLHELGTGGITQPVMIWSPAAEPDFGAQDEE
jgi:hypothetical protein